MDTSSLITALSMGFIGSLHCAGMCGPIALILPFQQMKGWKKAAGIGAYHFARISVYAFMGLLLHSFKSVFHPQWQQYVSIFLGAALLLFGALSFLSARFRPGLPWLPFIKANAAKFMGGTSLSALLMSGMVNGLLPCGLVYIALALAVNAAGSMGAIGTMYAFGLGTMPMLLTITLLKAKIPFLRSPYIRKQVPLIMLFFGALFVVRGMNLGVPYLSPKIEITGDVINASCCQHKH